MTQPAKELLIQAFEVVRQAMFQECHYQPRLKRLRKSLKPYTPKEPVPWLCSRKVLPSLERGVGH